MKTEVITIKNTDNPAEMEPLDQAARILKNGGLVVFPTETVYGLGGNGLDPEASKKIYAAKGRPSDNPLILHVSSPEEAENYAFTNDTYYRLAKAFMPGPLTVILPKKDNVPLETTGGLPTVAIRCPSHPIAHEMIRRSGVPVAAPSANLSGKPSPTRAEHVIHDLMGKVDMIIDGGECDIGLESTIVKVDGTKLTLLRPGGVTYDALCCVSDSVEISPAVTEELKKNERPLSPGLKYKHYAPSSPVVLLTGEESKILSFLQKKQETERCLILCYEEEFPLLNKDKVYNIGKSRDLDTQAHLLFSALRNADLRDDIDIVYAHLPTKEGLGLALYNRLIRAAAHTILTIE